MVKNMRDGRRSAAARARVYLVTGIVTVAALVGMIGLYQYTNRGNEAQLAQNQEEGQESLWGQSEAQTDLEQGGASEQTELAYDKTGFDDYRALYQEEEAQAAMADRADMYDEADDAAGADGDSTVIAGNIDDGATGDDQESQAAFSEDTGLSFGSDSTINWPVQGNVLMNYSMDKTVYFATLDQYKYNPAIVIDASVNDKVLAGAACKITDIETNENTGTTVTVDLGDGYQAIYGQLKEVKKKVGDTLAADDVVGYIAEPTKYYSVEGSNLYFAMTKDGEPVNPMEFLK